MLIIPAIDLLDGQCVRLVRGDIDNKKIYSDHPNEIALQWQEQGAMMLHVVDLNGAFENARINDHALKKILSSIDIPVQVGGGIRTIADAKKWFDLGVHRIIISTVALTQPQIAEEMLSKFGHERIILGLDARNGKLAFKGWQNSTDQTPLSVALYYKRIGLEHIIYTDIQRDGVLQGPDYTTTIELVVQTGLQVIASGGFAKVEHFQILKQMTKTQLEGAIVGTALYEKELDLKELVTIFQN